MKSPNRAHLLFLLPVATLLLHPGSAFSEITRLGNDVVPVAQTIHLKIDADRADYTGSVHVDLTVKAPVTSFRMSGRRLTLTTIALADAKGPVTATAERSGRAEVEGIFTLTTSRPLVPGPATLDIDYANTFDTHSIGLYRTDFQGHGYVFTQLEADDARLAFPCWDEPEFKIPYQLTIDVPAAHSAVTNTPVTSETSHGDWKTLVFGKTRPFPSYLLAIAAGPLEFVPVPGTSIPTRIVTVKGQSHLAGAAAAVTPPLLAALEKWFDEPYPYEKLDLIAVPEFWPGGMENPGAITFADRVLLQDAAEPDASLKLRLASIVAHELSHMWFGDVVTMRWWDDLWLNESFADWMGDKITEQVYPELEGQLKELSDMQSTMNSDARPTARAVHKPIADMNDLLAEVGVAYNKGKRVLAHFENWMGTETFRQGIHRYMDAHRWGNARADDLWQALGEASGKDVKAVMAGFTDQPGYPLISVDVLPEGRIRLSQRRFSNHGTTLPPLTWHIPVGLKYSDGSAVKTQTVLLSEAERIVDLGASKGIEWVMPNANAGGYYRWNVTGDGIDRLSRNAVTSLTPAERIGLIGNLGGLLSAGLIDGRTFLETLSRFSEDSEPLVINAVIENLEDVRTSLVPDDLREPFAGYVRRTLGPALNRFGLEKAPGESESVGILRPVLLNWLGREGGDPAVLDFAKAKARAYEADPSSVDPATAGVVLRIAAMHGDGAAFERYRKAFESAPTPEIRSNYLAALSGFTDPAIQSAALDYSMSGPLRTHEIMAIPREMNRTERDRQVVFEWICAHFEPLSKRLSPAAISFLPRTANGCSMDRLASAVRFFGEPGHRVDGTERNLANVTEAVKANVELRRREGPGVAAWLRSAQ